MNLTGALKDIQLPPVVVKIDEDTLRNVFVVIMVAGALLMVTWIVLSRVANK